MTPQQREELFLAAGEIIDREIDDLAIEMARLMRDRGSNFERTTLVEQWCKERPRTLMTVVKVLAELKARLLLASGGVG